ncbi:MAG: hypothetical protein PHP10_05275 [Candidatus Omnitrophica bacterium]|nr:hypothetical protein [Candidatus Omnitrophota bacterium]
MKLEEFLKRVRGMPLIDAENLLAGVTDPGPVKVQLSRWRKSGKLIKLKNNIYLLAENFRKVDIYEPHIASVLKKPSYISLEKAFEYHGLIPEGVPVYTSVTTKRPERILTPIGAFDYRHIKNSLFWGYDSVIVNKQQAFIAQPEKALLDFFYLKGLGVDDGYLEEMRLQNFSKINCNRLITYAKRFERPGVLKVARMLKSFVFEHKKEEKHL